MHRKQGVRSKGRFVWHFWRVLTALGSTYLTPAAPGDAASRLLGVWIPAPSLTSSGCGWTHVLSVSQFPSLERDMRWLIIAIQGFGRRGPVTHISLAEGEPPANGTGISSESSGSLLSGRKRRRIHDAGAERQGLPWPYISSRASYEQMAARNCSWAGLTVLGLLHLKFLITW